MQDKDNIKEKDTDYIDGQQEISKDLYVANELVAVAAEGKSVPQKKSRRRITYILLVLLLFLSAGVFGYYKISSSYSGKEKIVETQWGKITLNVPQSQEVVNVLAIGFDKGGYRTDTMMIINFDPKTSNVSLISIPRDTMVGIKGKRMKLNSAFTVGKFDMTLNAIRKLTGLPIHYYVAVDTDGFKNIIDTLGGVQFDVPKDMKYYDPYQNLNIDLKKGPQLLDGNKAEQLVRYRKYVTGDLEREDVQKKFIKALIQQKINFANISDTAKMKSVYDSLNKHVKTNASYNDAVKYFVAALKIKPESFKTYTLPGQARNINNISYYIYDKNQTQKMINEIIGQSLYTDIVGVDQTSIQLYDISEVLSKVQKASADENAKTSDQPEKQESGKNNNTEILKLDDGSDLIEDKDEEISNQDSNNVNEDANGEKPENLEHDIIIKDQNGKNAPSVDGITYTEETQDR